MGKTTEKELDVKDVTNDYVKKYLSVYKKKDAKLEEELGIKFDENLKNGNGELVSKITEIEYEGETKHLLSFASKYCSLSDLYGPKTDAFSLYDSIVCDMLKRYGFKVKGSSDKAELYKNYRAKIEEFKTACELKVTCRQIDQFLWLKGKIEKDLKEREASKNTKAKK